MRPEFFYTLEFAPDANDNLFFEVLFLVDIGLNEKSIDWSGLNNFGQSLPAPKLKEMLARELHEECVREVLALFREVSFEKMRLWL